jgi:hypothetical protein
MILMKTCKVLISQMIAAKEILWMEYFHQIEQIFNKAAVLIEEGRLLSQIN